MGELRDTSPPRGSYPPFYEVGAELESAVIVFLIVATLAPFVGAATLPNTLGLIAVPDPP